MVENTIGINRNEEINVFFDDKGKSLQKILEEFILVTYHKLKS